MKYYDFPKFGHEIVTIKSMSLSCYVQIISGSVCLRMVINFKKF